ncbi:MAG: hypothetical protein K9M44_03590 [Candidatus Pacebacteria bacterium]|nr:hypothetical protein [Candidatus Paceibacterota bacterium]
MVENEKLKFLEENIEKIALDKDRFGPLIFTSANTYLTRLQQFFKELADLNYQDYLTENETTQIDQKLKRLSLLIEQLRAFDLKQENNFTTTHDNYENEVKNFYQDVMNTLRGSLIYLRQEVGLKNKDEKELQEQQKKAVQAEKKFNELSEKLSTQIEKLDKQKIEIEQGKGEVATKILAKHFAKQANDYTEKAEGKPISKNVGFWKFKKLKNKNKGGWLKSRAIFYYVLMVVITINFILYFAVFWLNKIGKIEMETSDIFTPEYGIMKLALVALLYYGVYFSSKNYFIYSDLADINKQRKNVAQTLEDFLESNPEDKETLSVMMQEGVQAMFRHIPGGHLKQDDKNEKGLVNVTNKFPFSKE